MAAKKPNKDCFIIMPITTPADLVDKYSHDKDHFKHVLNHLFVPAVEKAGFNPVPPVAKGSDLIHGEIIKNIEQCQFLLCDMSILNPNVFFELGIRTALNKRVALVKDSATPKVPFDMGIINSYTYSHLLRPWTQEDEIEALSKHLTASFVGGKDENSLWSYFSITGRAKPLGSGSDEESRLDYLSQQISALRNEIKTASNNQTPKATAKTSSMEELHFKKVEMYAHRLANDGRYIIHNTHRDFADGLLLEAPEMPAKDVEKLADYAEHYGITVQQIL